MDQVSEGGLEPPRRWYIPESGIHHHSNVARRRCPARQFAMRASRFAAVFATRTGAVGEWRAAASPQLEEDDREGCRAASPVSVRRSTGTASGYGTIYHVLKPA